jgi:hypothetical protein
MLSSEFLSMTRAELMRDGLPSYSKLGGGVSISHKPAPMLVVDVGLVAPTAVRECAEKVP